MKTLKITAIFILLAQVAFGQNSEDYLRYSKTMFGGTARTIGMGGAFGAVGADFSTLSTNPAGMGIYKKSDFFFSPTYYMSSVNSNFNSIIGKDNKSNFRIGSAGIVFAGENDKDGWNYLQFGFGVNRTNNYNDNIIIEAENSKASLISIFQDQAFGSNPSSLNQFSTFLAWETLLLLDTVRTNNGQLAYTSYLNKGGTKHTKIINRSGSTNEMVISFSGSYQDKFYLGGTIGFPFVNYQENASHIEEDVLDTIVSFRKFVYNQNLSTSGTGVNFKFGMIFRPITWMRLGVAYHSPTILNLKDEYQNDMTSMWDAAGDLSAESGKGLFDYKIITPSKVIGSVAFTIKKLAILSADIEYVDYSNGEISAKLENFNTQNNIISTTYTSAINIHAGAEIKLKPMALRVGMAMYGSPYKNNLNSGNSLQYTGGLGFKQDHYYMDIAYAYSIMNEDYYLYEVDIDAANLTFVNHRLMFTLGSKF